MVTFAGQIHMFSNIFRSIATVFFFFRLIKDTDTDSMLNFNGKAFLSLRVSGGTVIASYIFKTATERSETAQTSCSGSEQTWMFILL